MSGGITTALLEMLGQLKLNAIRERLGGLLDESAPSKPHPVQNAGYAVRGGDAGSERGTGRN